MNNFCRFCETEIGYNGPLDDIIEVDGRVEVVHKTCVRDAHIESLEKRAMKLKAERLYWKALAKSSYHKTLSGLSIHGEGWIRQNIDRSIQWDSLANRIQEKYGSIK